MGDISKRIANLSPKKRILLEKKLKEKKIAQSSMKSIPRRENPCFAPLSYAQQRLWFLNQLEPDSPFYNIAQVFRVHGTINIDSLLKTLNTIINRHETFRTTFKIEGEEPVQVISTKLTLDLPTIDISESTGKKREIKIRNLISEFTKQPFDLSCGPLIRFHLIRVDDQEHIFVFVMHHIVSDGWSMGIFNRELKAFYNSFCSGEPYTPQDLPIQYADFSQWQRQWFKGNVMENQLDYWRKQFKNVPSLLELPIDHQRPLIQSFRGSKEYVLLSNELTKALKALSIKENVTLFMTLLAAFQLLLFRYTGQKIIVTGSPISNRTISEIENLIGFFVNTLVFRADFSDNPTFSELLKQVRQGTLNAFENQDLPFEKVVEELQPERSLSYSPIFQVMFTFQNDPPVSLDLSNLTLTQVKVDYKSSKFDLTLFVSETDQGLRALIEYNTDLFNRDTIRRMLGHFQTLLESIANDSGSSISTLPILTKGEQEQLLLEWNNTKIDYPLNKGIHQLFEMQVEKSLDAVAVANEDDQLTYRELNKRSNQLAHYLQKLGIGPEILVGICMERSIEMVISLVGILKAGGAYIPLDPSYPKERLKFMIDDSNSEILLTTKNLLKCLPDNNIKKICLDNEWNVISKYRTENLPNANVRNLAYVIYTSGSTGKPKGVAIEHEAVVNQMYWMQDQFKLSSNDLILQKTPYSFDVSVSELFFPLMFGSRLLLAKPEGHKDPDYLIKLIQEHKVTILQFVPSMLQVFLESKDVEKCVSVRQVICAGEALSYELKNRFFSIFNAQLINLYGPTEAAIYASYWECSQSLPQEVVPIGYPISNYKLYILDNFLQPVPIGVSGGLYIGGVGLARGYINRPDLTDERFIDNPFKKYSNERLYRTGDLACYLPDGAIKFLGRIDHQVKVRGFRIELGEIESSLSQHPCVREVVVLVLEDEPGNKWLVAYIVPEEESIIQSTELRSFLKEKLPEYMVPSIFVMLSELPLTPNGKVDRKALPVPDQERPELEKEFVAPRTSEEKELTEIWCEVLKLKQVGIYDNFFELGGHSLLATRVMARTRDAFNVELPLQTFFMSPTIADLSKKIIEVQNAKIHKEDGVVVKSLTPIPKRKDISPAILSFAQKRLWFLDQYEPGSYLYNIPMVFRLRGKLNVEALHNAINSVISRHESLRTTFTTKEGDPVQVIVPTLNLDLPLIDICNLTDDIRESEIQRLINEEYRKPFDLSSGPLLRTALLRLNDDEHVFLLTIHHIISDGWSMTVINQELGALYAAFCSDEQSPLLELPIQYADFAEWHDGWLKEEELENQLDYWKGQLNGIPSILELPNDNPRPTVQSFKGAVQSMILSTDISEDLKNLSHREEVTLFMTLLSAFQILLFRYTGQKDIVVGFPIANRTRKETEELIGFFVNTLMLRGDLSGNPTFREYLRQIKEVTLAAYENQDLPFEKLVEELNPERTLSHSTLFQVLFTLQNTPTASLELSGLSVVPLKSSRETSKFDLSMFVTNTEQEGMRVLIEHSTDLFDSTTIKRMLGHYQVLLKGIIANPGQCIYDLPLLTEFERDQLIVKWNDTKTDYPDNLCIHQLFDIQTKKNPDSIAVVYEDTHLSYNELNEQANQLAHYLGECGVGPNILVGICMDRSLEMMVGLLGILKAGGAYVPLDPAYPRERLEFMLEDTKAQVLLTERRLLESDLVEGVQVIYMDRLDKKISSYSVENLQDLSNTEDLAYVIYTSGSTGIPKGVEIPHRGVVRLLFGVDYVELGSDETFLQSAPVSFDASTFEIWGSLLHGAKCVLFPERVPTPEDLGDVIKKYGVSVLWLTSSLFNTVIDEAPGGLSRLKQLLIGGESLSASHVRRALEILPSTQIINGYGPTENTTFTCCYPIPRQLCNDTISIPIGRPISNTEVYILDTHLNPVPIGVYGELYISGAGLARGYLNHLELTAEKFIPNPYNKDSNSRLYKTGDVARYLPDGNIEISGRLDNQVKVRGYRIETGEIEYAVKGYPDIKECVVILKENKTNREKLLIMYIVPDDEESAIPIKELKIHIKQKLPYFMVPSGFVFLKSLPLNKNGKVDRIALAELDNVDTEHETKYVGPRSVLELQIVQIWEKLIGKQPIGVKDDFFNLGGSSLLAIRVISEIERISKVKLPLQDFLEVPTIENVAEILAGSQLKNERIPGVIGIQTSGDKLPFFCVSVSQKGNGLEYVRLSRYLDPNQPVYTPYLGNLKGKVKITDAATECVKNMKSFQSKGPYFLGGWCYGGYVAFEAARQLEEQGEKVGMLALLDTHGPNYGYKYRAYLTGRVMDFIRLPNKEKKSRLKLYYIIFRMRLRGFKRKKVARKQTDKKSESKLNMHHIDWYPKPLSCKIEVFMVKDQSEGRYYGEHYGWKDLSLSNIRTHTVPGDHVTFLSKYYKELGQCLGDCLKDAQKIEYLE